MPMKTARSYASVVAAGGHPVPECIQTNRSAERTDNNSGRVDSGVDNCSLLLEAVKIKFADVLGTTLDEAAGVMKGPKIHIHLRPDLKVRPLSVAMARPVPKHFEGMATKLISELITSGVLVPETGPTEWCSPAHFVPKPGGQKLRLVTDYRRLNEAVIRTVHPFPAAADLIKRIDPTSRYRYLGAPMGLNTSSDEFCCRTDKAVEGLPWLLKIVDDMLVQAPDLKTLFVRLEEVLMRCRQSGIKISLSKLELNVDRKTIYRVKKCLQDEESMDRKRGGGRLVKIKIQSTEIKNAVMANPTKSIRSHAIDLGVSKDTVSKAIRMEGGKSLVMKKKPLPTPLVKEKHLFCFKGLLNNLKSAAAG
ncbi:uncharacterized protein LOC131884853 [Tigriopus californicus]|uniref:uncharacterized protein LOC131884853 n=1 Tax=Tigriopus californicus TaxID=6832 RepID=UPI0027D9F2F5|nr:uncharacterized protein LOC131884853 [Tigriopus californicus]